MNWLKKAVKFRGRTSPKSIQWYRPPGGFPKIDPRDPRSDPTNLYAWPPDNPRIFLGPADSTRIKEVESITGQPVCRRIDVAFHENTEIPGTAPASSKYTLPEHENWSDPEIQQVWPEFKSAADDIVKTFQTTNCPIYVHCKAGINRSAAVLAAALTRITGQTLQQILMEMKSQRFIISPHDSYFAMAAMYSPSDSPEWKQQVWSDLDVTGKEKERDDWSKVSSTNWLQKIASKFGPDIKLEQAITIGKKIGIDWNKVQFPPEEFRRGIEVEFEHSAKGPAGHGGDVINGIQDSAKIAWAHLNEISDYYTRLDQMEQEADQEGTKEAARHGPMKAQSMSFKEALRLMRSWGFDPIFKSRNQGSHCWFEKRDPGGEVVCPHTVIGYIPQHGGAGTNGITIKEIFKNAAQCLGVSLNEFLSGPKPNKSREKGKVCPECSHTPDWQRQIREYDQTNAQNSVQPQ